MEDFDTARDERLGADRRFKIGGEVFERRPGVKPEVMFDYEDLTPEDDASASHKVVVDLIFAFVEPKDHERLRAVIDQDEHPVTIADLNALVRWLIRSTSQRPTLALSSSPDGRAETGTTSTEPPSTEPAEASVA